MSKDPFVILGVSPNATQSEIFDAYTRLRDKYSNDRFLEGEAGAEAARKLNELYDAYNDAMEISSRRSSISGGGTGYASVENAIRAKNFGEAQRLLDAISERDGEWHYLQSVVHYNNNWLEESKKQLEIAVELEPSNEKYRRSLEKLKTNMNGAKPHAEEAYNPHRASNEGYRSANNYGSNNSGYGRSYNQNDGGMSSLCNACSACICADCCCECMGGDLIPCC